jgi:hypothetical protein
MSDESTPDVPPPSEIAPSRWRKILRLTGVGLIVVPILLIVLWTWIALNWAYSDGERAGTLQKFSRKGWICKTWEGELQISTIPGSAPILWEFSVRDNGLASQLEEAIAHSGRVVLQYEEHRGIPTSCFGDTQYFVTAVRLVR